MIFNTNLCTSRFENVGGSCKDAVAIFVHQNMIILSILSSLRSATPQFRAENKTKDAGTFKHPIMRIIQVTIVTRFYVPHSGGEHITALGLQIPEVEEFIFLPALDCPCPCSFTAGCRSIQSDDWFLMFLLFTISCQDKRSISGV